MTRCYPVTDQYDLDLSCSGDGWCGTYHAVLREALMGVLDGGPYGPVEVTLQSYPDNVQVAITGMLVGLMGEVNSLPSQMNTVLVASPGSPNATCQDTTHRIDIDDIRRFRA